MDSISQSERAASDLLEDALQQFDNIIEGTTAATTNVSDLYRNGGIIVDEFQGIGQLMEDLRMTIEAEQISSNDGDILLSHLSPSTLQFYRDLFKVNKFKMENENETLQRLKNENDSLTLQVSVLTDQVELQTEKINDFENAFKEQQSKLLSTEESLQSEILLRTENKSNSLALREQISSMKIQLVQHEQLERQFAESSPQRSVQSSDQIDGRINPECEIMSPDEGIVHDHIQDKQVHMLKMPDPTATSTPIATGALNTVHNDSPMYGVEKSPENLATPKTTETLQNNDWKIEHRSVSLERLQGCRVLLNAETQSVCSGQDVNITSNDKGGNPVPKEVLKESSGKATSSPNLAMTEIERGTENPQIDVNSGNSNNNNTPSPFHNRKKHGFKKFFSSFRLRRSNSSNLQSLDVASPPSLREKSSNSSSKLPASEVAFQRGGLRATAGPRLGWSQKTNLPSKTASNLPFAKWDVDDICDWLTELGLVAYIPNCRAWVKNGATLLQATNQDLEKELGIRNSLHKKKLMLSLQALGEEEECDGQMMNGAKMDQVWVSRWLDDIGLPQYKDSFHSACIDGRMLHHLTVADLQRLRVTNLLHTLSLRRAIYTLRAINFDPTLLKRRPVESGEKENVLLWTNHRVMEWLRTIDLAEYAPNLRGSGVHGSLMVLEPQFNGEVISSLLHIPNSKSLLRRHLSAKFDDLIPPEYLKLKQSESSVVSVTAKVKIGRRSFAPLSRLRGHSDSNSAREFSGGEFVCPIETKNSGIQRSFGAHRRELEARLQMQESKDRKHWDISDEENEGEDEANEDIKVIELDESTTRKIGAFSAELATMTNKWSQD